MALTPRQKQIKEICLEKLNLDNAKLGDEYYYHSIVFCLIDAIFSIGVYYSNAKLAVKNYCDHYHLDTYDETRARPLDTHTISDFIKNIQKEEGFTTDYGASSVYNKRLRTSSRSGILKSQAVYNAALILAKHNINCLADIKALNNSDLLERDFRSIHGQRSGISFSYFMMLSGDDYRLKIDRWLLRFAKDASGLSMTIDETYADLLAVCDDLVQSGYPNLTPRLLDYQIWKYSIKDQKSKRASSKRTSHSRGEKILVTVTNPGQLSD